MARGIRLPRWPLRRTRVYVDAKILNMHDPTLERETFVGYIVEGGDSNAIREKAAESDDAEVLAVLFAIKELKDKLGKMTIICDHESVVSEANRDEAKDPSELMRKLRETLRASKGTIELKALQSNPAHVVVTRYVNSTKGVGQVDPAR